MLSSHCSYCPACVPKCQEKHPLLFQNPFLPELTIIFARQMASGFPHRSQQTQGLCRHLRLNCPPISTMDHLDAPQTGPERYFPMAMFARCLVLIDTSAKPPSIQQARMKSPPNSSIAGYCDDVLSSHLHQYQNRAHVIWSNKRRKWFLPIQERGQSCRQNLRSQFPRCHPYKNWM